MKGKYKTKTVLLTAASLLMTLLLTGSCTAEGEPAIPSCAEDPIESIQVSIARRNVATSATNPYEEDYFDIDEFTPFNMEFDVNSVIQISQYTEKLPPFYTGNNIYNYKFFNSEPKAGWDLEDTYNFSAYNNSVPLNWKIIGDGLSVNSGFAMYSLYFPLENKIRQTVSDGGAIHYSVMQDQSTVENLQKSDILGAYHSASELFTRLRFRMFHLMTYLRIRLYVPVFREDKNTGFREGALQYATFDNATPEFTIDWSIIPSSDTEGPVVTPLPGDGNIIMYMHPLDPDDTEHPKTVIKYADYLRDGYFDQGLDTDYDEVRVYDFSVIIPRQEGMTKEDGTPGNFTDSEFLNFYFRTNSGATTRYYFKQDNSATSNSSKLELDQGVYQYLQLYVPRVGNQIIFVGAHVEPWNHYNSHMMLLPEDDN